MGTAIIPVMDEFFPMLSEAGSNRETILLFEETIVTSAVWNRTSRILTVLHPVLLAHSTVIMENSGNT